MTTPRMFFLLSWLFFLTGCADMMQVTPQMSLTSGDKAMKVKSKVSVVSVLDYSQDGKNLVSGGASSSLRVWDVENAKEARAIPFPVQWGVFDMAYSPDGKNMAVSGRTGLFSGDNTRLLEVATGRELQNIAGEFGGRLSYSPDGKYLLGSELNISFAGTENKTKLVDVQSGTVVRTFDGFDFGTLSPDGRHAILVSEQYKGLALFELNTGREIWRRSVMAGNFVSDGVGAVAFTPDNKYILASRSEFHGTLGSSATISIDQLDAETGNTVRELVRFNVESTFFAHEKGNQQLSILVVSPDGTRVLSGNPRGEYKLWDMSNGQLIRQLKRPDEKMMLDMSPPHAAFSPNGKLVAITSAASVRMFDVVSGEEAAALIAFDDGEWLVTTPSGYYNSSEKGDQYLDVSVAGKSFSTSQLRESFFRPDLVKVALSGGSLRDYRKIEDVKQPPVIAIVDTPASVNQDQVTLILQVKDQGGGVGDVRLYRNGTAVVLEKTRNLQLQSTAQGGQVLQYTVSLESGRNVIRAVAFNADNSMQSSEATLEIQASFAPRPPTLYAVVVGIKDYVNPRLALSYPVADAELFATTLKNKGKGLFENVQVHRLLTPAETTNVAITAALKQAQKDVRPEDLFVFYVASHGTVDDGQYFLITSNVGSTSTAHLKQDALSQDVFKELISNIPASKKLVVLDTCNAGKMGDALQMAMMTRGMSEDTAMKVLSRAVGSTILSAASSVQEALEGYKNHGLFTWVVVEGLNGDADADKDGFVKTLELADYVDNQVPELAERVFHHKQFPIVSPTGQGFPLVRVRQ
ncbi:MAG: caspase family protein [Gallionella sp.]|nr:caspase family protein [Gallionella sp.]